MLHRCQPGSAMHRKLFAAASHAAACQHNGLHCCRPPAPLASLCCVRVSCMPAAPSPAQGTTSRVPHAALLPPCQTAGSAAPALPAGYWPLYVCVQPAQQAAAQPQQQPMSRLPAQVPNTLSQALARHTLLLSKHAVCAQPAALQHGPTLEAVLGCAAAAVAAAAAVGV